jgi:DNA-binding NtrC family response regulator
MNIDTTIEGGTHSIEVTGGTLVVLSPENGRPAGAPIPIGPEPCLVGRGSHCRLILEDPRVSTSHCSLTSTIQGVQLTDLGSRNGTFVNQVRLEQGSAVYLSADARIRCGQTWLAFQCTGREQVPINFAPMFGPFAGRSAAMQRIYAQLKKITSHELNVLVTGETGTGKELVAQAIHGSGQRREQPFVTVDCTAIPASLAESKLFGHGRGAFTGAIARQTSPFEDACGGTIFFDELGELPIDIQPKLLRVLETRKIQILGSNRDEPIDVRIVAATRRNLHAEMNAKRFRDDLYYRFAQVVIDMPPLRHHPEDIPDLVAHFFAELGDPEAIQRVDVPSMNRLKQHEWPGNVRELRNVVLAAYADSDGGPIEVIEFLRSPATGLAHAKAVSPCLAFHALKREVLEALEREYFARLHAEAGGNVSEISRRCGLSRPMVREYLQRHRLREAE